MQVIPSILEKDVASFLNQLKKLTPYFNTFQIDIADGIFVPNKTLDINDIILTIKQFNNTTISNLVFDFHLMIKDYEKEVKKLSNLVIKKSVNIKNIFIHYSLFPNYQLLITNYPSFSFGLVLNPEDSIELLTSNFHLQTIPAIQIMSVNPGFQGSEFIPETLKKIEQLRLQDYRNKIYLDGAINQSTLPLIKSLKYRPDYICPGSFLTKAKNLQKNINFLKEKIS